MSPRTALFSAGALLLATSSLAAPRPVKPDAATPPARTRVLDIGARLDINRLDLFTTNVGSLGYDFLGGAAGLFYPKGDPTSVLFGSGLWIAGTVNGQERGALAEYSFEFGPGTASGGTFDDPTRADFKSYRVRTHSDPADTVGWGDYVANAGAQGAPVKVHQLPDPNDPQQTVPVNGPDLPGDLAIWTVFNDLDPLNHGSSPGGTAPLGVEVRQQVYGFDAQNALGDVAFVDWTIKNASNETITDAAIAFWSDPDVGGFTDDLVGWDSIRTMAYAYNGSNNDTQYGTDPPAIGFVLLSSPTGPLAFARYVNGTDPNSITETIRTMHGLLPDGSPYLDPETNQPSAFPFSGDPIAGSGWLDTSPADRRMLISTGPVTLAPGEVTHVVYAIVVGQGTNVVVQGSNRLASVAKLRCEADIVRQAYAQDFVPPFPEDGASCMAVQRCPRPAQFWATECASPNVLTPEQLGNIAECATGTRSLYFNPPPLGETDFFCATVAAGATPREKAEREFATLLANGCTGESTYLPGAGPLPGFPSFSTPIDCPGVTGTTVGELLEPAGAVGFYNAAYENNDATHPRAIEGVDFGFPHFNGGAALAYDFAAGSTINPNTMPDSMTSVRIVFDATRPHSAYRYLRLEELGGGAPTPGRAYLYGGYVPIPLYALDLTTGDTLEVGFAERTVTDADGTILDPGSQVATFDSTWSPSDEADGGREYLFVFKRPQSGAPRPEFATDGALFDGSLPGLYALAARRFDPSSVFDDGDAFVFEWGTPPTRGIDQQMIDLAAQPQGDAATLLGYNAIASCLAGVNNGSAIGAQCSPGTPALATLIESTVTSEQVALTWFVTSFENPAFEIERRENMGAWTTAGGAVADGTGRVTFVDRAVLPGQSLSYRLAQTTAQGRVTQGEKSVVIPAAASASKFALAVRASTGGDLSTDFVLPRAGAVRFDVVTATGRRVYSWDAGVQDAGRHTLSLPGSARLPGGFYLVRARHDGADATAKAIVLR